MAVLKILQFPNPQLRKKAVPVEQVDDVIRKLVDDMLETMYGASGIGLAATQVNVQKAVLVADVDRERSAGKNKPICLINPEIIERHGETEYEEGCLSVPGCTAMVKRSERIKVRALDTQGQSFTLDADDLLAICIQHEMDHLQGKLFIDHLSPLKRERVISKVRTYQAAHTQSPVAAAAL